MRAKLKSGLLLLGVLVGAVFMIFYSEIRLNYFYWDLHRQINDPDAPSVFQEDGEFKDLKDQFPVITIT
jgi:hypothetical protein